MEVKEPLCACKLEYSEQSSAVLFNSRGLIYVSMSRHVDAGVARSYNSLGWNSTPRRLFYVLSHTCGNQVEI